LGEKQKQGKNLLGRTSFLGKARFFSHRPWMVVLLAKEEQGIQSPNGPERLLGSLTSSSPRLQLQLLVASKTSGTSRPLGEQREGLQTPEASDRRPCLLQCFLRAPPPPSRRRRESSQHLPGPQPHTTSETPQTPLPPKQTTSALRSSSLEWRSIRAWVDFVFWWLESLLLAEASSVVNQRFC